VAALELSRYELIRLIQQVDQQLAANTDHQHDLMMAGGAAVALLWNDRRRTNDIDIVSEGMTDDLREAIERVAGDNKELDLKPGWFNDAAKVAVPNLEMPATDSTLVYDGERLRLYSAPARVVLAMKLFAARATDRKDALALMREVGIASRQELYDLVRDGYGTALLRPAVQYFVDQVWEEYLGLNRGSNSERAGPDLGLGL